MSQQGQIEFDQNFEINCENFPELEGLNIVPGLEQNSDAWMKFRIGKIGGSSAPNPFGDHVKLKKDEIIALFALDHPEEDIEAFKKLGTAPKMWAYWEDIDGPEYIESLKDFYRDYGVDIAQMFVEYDVKPIEWSNYVLDGRKLRSGDWAGRGHVLEPLALAEFTKRSGKYVHEGLVIESNLSKLVYVSPDGVISANEACEVKSLSWAAHYKAWRALEAGEDWITVLNSADAKKKATHYPAQVVQYFLVMEELEQVNFIFYSDQFKNDHAKMNAFLLKIKREDVQPYVEQVKKYYVERFLPEYRQVVLEELERLKNWDQDWT